MSQKALIAMSGGVDSSVAAWMMKEQGFDCMGVMMKLYENEDAGIPAHQTCCSLEDAEDARSVAFRLGMPFYVFNYKQDFCTQVMDRFAASYEAGETPNPCIECNRYMKFEKLLQRAKELQMDYVVTGHYARIVEEIGLYLLKKGLDESKDQSYLLYMLNQEQLAHIRLPLGELRKTEVREIAEREGFLNAHKHDSQDICFVPDGDYVAFLERHTGRHYEDGPIVDLEGKQLGTHHGAIRYTMGQRKGLNLAVGSPIYVCGKDMAKNTVIVGPSEALFSTTFYADRLNWIAFEDLTEPIRVKARTRYHQKEQWATVSPESDGIVRVEFEEPQRAVTPGQAVVFYQEDLVVGGGTILSR